VSEVVLHHHERFDGAGYPDGLAGENIPLPARIVCVVDAYCAMIAKRSYKESATPEAARQELLRCKGSHFDPSVVEAFLAVLDAPEEDDGDCGLPINAGDPVEFSQMVRMPACRR
jgi:HD-GYP domain-containing protein (c-di-GMP phosphodiesterase class II)